MKIVVPSVHVPFISGGAEMMTRGLGKALEQAGHDVEIVRFPFKFQPESYLAELSQYCLSSDFSTFNGIAIDKVIALQFPAYYVQHPSKVLWLMHQHRAVYDLYDPNKATGELADLKRLVDDYDTKSLGTADAKFSMSKNVSGRLQHYNGIESEPVYHPPEHEGDFFCDEQENFVFCPSRLETLKRQDLLIRALEYTTSPVGVIFAGDGGQRDNFKALAESLGVAHKMRFLGHISHEEKVRYYSKSLGVFFGPLDEDYGYVTLEAMLSSKPVITCEDSGGPLEFITDNESGFVVQANPEVIASKIDELYFNKHLASDMGTHARESYLKKGISWKNVVNRLLENA